MKDISMHIMDILQNSIRAEAKKITFSLAIDTTADTMTLVFEDDGNGMSEETLEKVLNPFFTTRTTRDVGLGLSLLKQNAEQTGGNLAIDSVLGKGTSVKTVMGYRHIDRQPIGDIAGTIVLTASSYPAIRFIFQYDKDDIHYIFDTDEINEALDGISIQDPAIIQYLKEMIEENIQMQ